MKSASLEKSNMGFDSAFMVGFGQMGKSISNTLRVNNFGGKIMVSSRSKVENCDFIDGNFDCNDVTNDYNNSVIFICTPPRTVPEIVAKMLDMTKNYKNCVVSDICSIKQEVAKIHDKTVAFTSHLQNLILASYYNDFSKIDNQMWREIFIQNQKNITHFMKIFLEKVQEKIDNNLLADAIILADKSIMMEEKFDIKKELFNPSLIAVFELKNGSMNYQNFVKNMHNFFENLIGKKTIRL